MCLNLSKLSFCLINFSIFVVILANMKFHSNCFVCLCYGAAGLPLFFPGILPDLQPVYQVSNHRKKLMTHTARYQRVTQLVLLCRRSSGRWRSWILRRCPTRSCSSPRGAFRVSSWWVRVSVIAGLLYLFQKGISSSFNFSYILHLKVPY